MYISVHKGGVGITNIQKCSQIFHKGEGSKISKVPQDLCTYDPFRKGEAWESKGRVIQGVSKPNVVFEAAQNDRKTKYA